MISIVIIIITFFKFEVLTPRATKIVIFCNVALSILVEVQRRQTFHRHILEDDNLQ